MFTVFNQYPTFLVFLAVVFAMVVTMVLTPLWIKFLKSSHIGQQVRADGPESHLVKQGTPTMGGLMFIIGSAAAVLLLGWPDFAAGRFGGGFVLLFALVFGVIGYIDDYVKVKKHQNTGLTAPQKFLLQLAAAIVFTVLMRNHHYLTPDLYIPFVNVTLSLPWPVYMVFAAFVMVGTVNAVNLTDGVDGLATGVTIPVMLFYVAVSAWYGRSDLITAAAAMAGGLSAFLIYNFHPAKVFMGDTGSLFLGGAVCGLAFALDIPLVLILVGIIYILETLSDILQVGYFKLTHGKRIFRMAPLHHHLELGGWSEVKLFCVFSGVTLLACVLAFLGVMGR